MADLVQRSLRRRAGRRRRRRLLLVQTAERGHRWQRRDRRLRLGRHARARGSCRLWARVEFLLRLQWSC